MARIIKKVALPPKLAKRKRVAAYTRVSSGKDAMLHSLSAQVAYYSNYIQSHEGWEYVGVYADEALTGTKDTRDEFQRLLQDCRDGKIDLVLTKAISRFARNTVTLLESVRELKNLGIDIYFEEQNIHTMSADGELMLTILASYAQEESLSASENQKWRIKANFEQGKPWKYRMFGYERKGDSLGIVVEEAKIVKRIFALYLQGLSLEKIRKAIGEDGYEFSRNGIMGILKNYAYTGNLLLQTTYHKDHISKASVDNHGEMPQYHVESSHEAIVPIATFQKVQEMVQARAKAHPAHGKTPQTYIFSGMLVCDECGKCYRRKTTRAGVVWICETYNLKGKRFCSSKQIPDGTLTALAQEILGTEELTRKTLKAKVSTIKVCNGNRIIFQMANGVVIEKEWKDRSRSESWTPEMRALAGQRTKRRYESNG